MFTLTIEDKHGGVADEYSFEEGEFLVGRSHGADIILPSDNVSRRHARLYTVDGRCFVEDMGSANGVFVNGRRIHEAFEIESSAQIRVGDYYLHVDNDAATGDRERVFFQLIGRNLSVADEVYRISRTVNLVGRGKDCTVTIIDPSVSRIHAKLSVERSGAITVEDLKSSNGTFVNDERIEVGTLSHGDLVRFGNVEFAFEVPDAPPRDDAESTGDFEGAWAPQQGGSNKPLLIALAGVAVAALVAVTLLFAFGVIGGDEEPAPEEVAAAAPDESQKGGDEDEFADDEVVVELLDKGRAQIKDRQWEQALDTFEKVLEEDPLHTEARKAINQVEIWQRHQNLVEEARALAEDEDYSGAARKLRDVDEGSIYYVEARDELQQLMEMKPSLVLQADGLVKSRKCEEALELYEQAQQLDPRDSDLAAKIAGVKKKADKGCR
ncbi:MAG: FHA domain-containing protein [Myxococcota bacterium]